jgi:ELWxxDGT repeat protein
MNKKRHIIFLSIFMLSLNNLFSQTLELVKDIAVGNSNSEVLRTLSDGDKLFYVVKNTNNSQSLWFYDNTVNTNTLLFTDSTHSSTRHPFGNLTLWNHKVLWAYGSIWERELWTSDGTQSGTIQLNANIGSFAMGKLEDEASSFGKFVVAKDLVYFDCKTTNYGSTELWRTDGTQSGTYFLDFINVYGSGMRMTQKEIQGNTFFYMKYSSFTSNPAQEIWYTNGQTVAKLRTIFPTSSVGYFEIFNFPNYAVVVSDSSEYKSLSFINNTTLSFETKHKNILSTSYYIYKFRTVAYKNNIIHFHWAGTANNEEIWKSDGTILGTIPITNSSTDKIYFTYNGEIEDSFLFEAYITPIPYYENFVILNKNNSNLKFVIDNFGQNIRVRKHFANFGDLFVPKAIVGPKFYFISNYDNEIYEIDSSSNVAVRKFNIPSPFIYADLWGVNNKLLVAKTVAGGLNRQLLVKSGETLSDLLDSLPSPKPTFVKVVKNTGSFLYFEAYEDIHGTELWVTNGTAIGTHLVNDANTIPSSSFPKFFNEFENGVFFMANNGKDDFEPWHIDNTNNLINKKHDIFQIATPYINASKTIGSNVFTLFAGNHLAKYNKLTKTFSLSSSLSLGPAYDTKFVQSNGLHFFTGYSSGSGEELYSINSSGSVTMVRDLYTNTSSGSFPLHLTDVNNTLYFTANGYYSGRELYKSNGSYSGTVLVKDINVGYGSSAISDLISFNNNLIFVKDTNSIWRSDGTDIGTNLLYNLGPSQKILKGSKVILNKLYFASSDLSNTYIYSLNQNNILELIGQVTLSTFKIIEFTEFNNLIYFSAGNGLYNLNNGVINIVNSNLNATEFISKFGKLFFRGCVNAECEIWTIDISGNITKAYDINPGIGGSNPSNLYISGRNIYFSAFRPDIGTELFRITDCPKTINLNTNHLVTEKLEVSEILNSNIKTFGFDVMYDAGKQINLLPGFETSNGHVFKAYINGCLQD